MQILYLVPDLFGPPGGIARYCRLVARALGEWETVKRLDTIVLWDPRTTLPDPEYLSAARSSYAPCGGNRTVFTSRVARELVRRPYDLVMCGHVSFAPLMLLALARPHTRRLTFLYGTDAWYRLRPLQRLPVQLSGTIVAISEHTARRAVQANHLDPARMRVLHNCLDPAFEAVPAVRAGAPGPPRIVTVSRMSKIESGKGHHSILRALPAVLQHVPDLRYTVIGEGDLRPDLERLVADLGIGHAVEFLGRLADAEVTPILAASTAYVMPSRYEGFGFVFLEAMAQGLPIVAGTIDAAREVVGDDAGLFVHPDDVPGLTAAVLRVVLDPDLRASLGAGGRRRVERFFRYDQFRSTLRSYVCEAQR